MPIFRVKVEHDKLRFLMLPKYQNILDASSIQWYFLFLARYLQKKFSKKNFKSVKIFLEISKLRTPCTFSYKHIYSQKLRLLIRNAFIPTQMKNNIWMKSYDHFNKNVNLPPPKNTNELKFSKSYFLPITHLMTKFQRPTTSWKNVK